MRKSVVIVALLCAASPSAARDIYVTNFAELSNAIFAANFEPGSTIYLAPVTYSGGELPVIHASVTLTLNRIRGSANGSAILATKPSGGKGILTVPTTARNVRLAIDGLTFQNAAIEASAGGNAAGIRFQGTGASALIVTNSTFHNNQNGILTGWGGPMVGEELVVSVSNSLFANNGTPSGFTHGIYTQGKSLDVTGTTFCGTIGGHDIKSRSYVTTVSDSVFHDGASTLNPQCGVGSASYSIDLPNGGIGAISKSNFVQGNGGRNSAIISYGAEGMAYPENSLAVSGSSFESSISGRVIQQLSKDQPACLAPVTLSDNTLSPRLTPVQPADCLTRKD